MRLQRGAELVGAALAALWLLPGCDTGSSGRLEGSGTIEADEVRVSSLVGGQIAEVLVREGDRVSQGDVLLRYDPADIELQADQARAALKAAEAQLALARAGARWEDIQAARELVRQAEAAETSAVTDLERVEALHSQAAATDKQRDDARTRHDLAVAQRAQAKAQYAKAVSGARPEELEMAEANVDQARAAVALAENKLADCEVVAPGDGVIVHRLVEPGEVGAPGGTLFVMQDLSVVRLTVYVPEPDLGRVSLGDPVAVTIDTHPDRTFPGRVARVRDEAEFTPKNVQTKDERVKLVFGVEIELDNPDGVLKPGLPADAVFGAAGAAPATTAEATK